MNAHLAQIKQQWSQLQTRFEALKPREQLMIVVAGVAILFALCDQLFWTPFSRSNTQLQNHIAGLKTQQDKLLAEHANIKTRLAENPDAELQRDIDAVKKRIDAQNKRLEELTVNLIPPEKMADVLREVLSHRRELQLVSLRNEAATFAFMPRDADKKGAPENGRSDAVDSRMPVLVYRHGLTLELKGRYFEIVNYLQALEQLPWHFYWERLDYKVDNYPVAAITVKIYTLSNREGWIGA